nr:MAG TPA: hypothetical protein [Caudoviricetes sp.]
MAHHQTGARTGGIQSLGRPVAEYHDHFLSGHERSGGEDMSLSPVMIAAGNNIQRFSRYPVDEAMLHVDAARPVSGKTVFQRFRFAQAAVGRLHDALQQTLNFRRAGRIHTVPMRDVFLRLIRKLNIHRALNSSSVTRVVFPDSISAMPFRKCSALAGLPSRYMVSCMLLKSSRLIMTTGAAFWRVIITMSRLLTTLSMVAARFWRASVYEMVFMRCSFWGTLFSVQKSVNTGHNNKKAALFRAARRGQRKRLNHGQ